MGGNINFLPANAPTGTLGGNIPALTNRLALGPRTQPLARPMPGQPMVDSQGHVIGGGQPPANRFMPGPMGPGRSPGIIGGGPAPVGPAPVGGLPPGPVRNPIQGAPIGGMPPGFTTPAPQPDGPPTGSPISIGSPGGKGGFGGSGGGKGGFGNPSLPYIQPTTQPQLNPGQFQNVPNQYNNIMFGQKGAFNTGVDMLKNASNPQAMADIAMNNVMGPGGILGQGLGILGNFTGTPNLGSAFGTPSQGGAQFQQNT